MLVLVDENDKEIGIMEKMACHKGEGVLHRAF
jgi:isopentenyldiphosphate isomerase